MTTIWPFPVPYVLAICAFLLVPGTALPASRTTQPEYVRLLDWAKTRAFSPSWIKHDDLLLLTRGSTRIRLKMASREANVNGVRVWLLYPAVQRDGAVRLSKVDIEKTLEPLIAPERAGRSVKTICLDPGHGGRDPGFQDGRRDEKTYTLLLAKEIRNELGKQKVKVVLTRSTDYYVDLTSRPEVAKRRGADMFVSLHLNAAGRSAAGTAKGVEVFALTPAWAPSTMTGDKDMAMTGNRYDKQNMYLAYQVQKALAAGLGADDRGVQRARFVVLKDAAMPSVLIEGGFMSHPAESRRIYDPSYRKRMAKAIADGIMAYKRVTDPKTK